MIVPLKRVMHYGLDGKDVKSLQHVLKFHTHPSVFPHDLNGQYGHWTVEAVKEYQRRHDLRQDGVVKDMTWVRLWTPRRWYNEDGYARWLYDKYELPLTPEQKLVAWVMFQYAHRDQIHYDQQRPMRDMQCPPDLDEYCDCSEWVTLGYRCIGAPDPNGYGYNGVGNTTSLMANGKRVSLSDLRVGDLVFYSDPWHVAVAISHTEVGSNGSEPAPYILPATYRPVYTCHRYPLS